MVSPWIAFGALIVSMTGPMARADDFNPTSFLGITNETVSEIAALVAFGADLHAYEGAVPQSSIGGIDIGVTATAVALPGSVTNALTQVGIQGIPHYVPVPKFNIQKALPGRLMFGSEFLPEMKIGGKSLIAYGFDLQWVAIDRPRLPPIAIRAQFNYSDLTFVSATTYGGDVLATYKLPLVDIYGGAGYRFANGHVSVPANIPPPPASINLDPVVDAGHFLVGAIARAGFFRITAEANFTTRGVNTYGTKLSLYF